MNSSSYLSVCHVYNHYTALTVTSNQKVNFIWCLNPVFTDFFGFIFPTNLRFGTCLLANHFSCAYVLQIMGVPLLWLLCSKHKQTDKHERNALVKVWLESSHIWTAPRVLLLGRVGYSQSLLSNFGTLLLIWHCFHYQMH